MKKNPGFKFLLACLIIFFMAHWSRAASPPLSVDDVIKLAGSGKGEAQVIHEIRQRNIDFEINSPVMQRLVQNGVSAGIVQVLLGLSGAGPEKDAPRFVSLTPPQPSLSILSEPMSANVFIDGESAGITPFLSNKIGKGRHRLRIEHPFYLSDERTFELDGINPAVIKIELEPKEPMVHVQVSVNDAGNEVPWTWLARARKICQDQPSVELKAMPGNVSQNEAVFILTDECKATYQGSGNACLEVLLWRGRVRTDMTPDRLPPCVARYIISDIRLTGIQAVTLKLNAEVSSLDPYHPNIALISTTGRLIETADRPPTPAPEQLMERLSGAMVNPDK